MNGNNETRSLLLKNCLFFKISMISNFMFSKFEDKDKLNRMCEKIKNLAQFINKENVFEYRQKGLTGKYLDKINEMEGIELNYIRNLIQSGNDEQISQYLEEIVSDLIKTTKDKDYFNSKM